MSRGVLRYEVPVDDQWHPIAYSGTIAHVGSRKTGVVEFWTVPVVDSHYIHDGVGRLITAKYAEYVPEPHTEWFRVFGTGHDTAGLYVGTTYDGGHLALVWHLYRYEVQP